MPLLLPAHLWKLSGRWETAGKELFKVEDRKGEEFCLAPTHEEVITSICIWVVVTPSFVAYSVLTSGHRCRQREILQELSVETLSDRYSMDGEIPSLSQVNPYLL